MKKTFLSRRSAADIGRAMGGHSNNYRGETEKRKLVHERRSSLLPPLKNIRHREGERGRSVTVVQGSLQWQRPLYGLPLPTLCNVTSLLLEYALRVPLRGRGLLSLTTRYEDIVLDNGYFGPRPYITCCPRWGSQPPRVPTYDGTFYPRETREPIPLSYARSRWTGFLSRWGKSRRDRGGTRF